MKLCCFKPSMDKVQTGLVLDDQTVLNLTAGGLPDLTTLLESPDLQDRLRAYAQEPLPRSALSELTLVAPVHRQEIWAAGVTYLRSKAARMEESDFSASAYDRVYEAVRPELFFKSMPGKVVAPGGIVGIRHDARWSVPEPELVLVLNSRRSIVGYTIGNDMSSRDIEGENLLYLPQAKIYRGSCAIGPFITVGVDESEARTWGISVEIKRRAEIVFRGETTVGKIKRSFGELAEFLFRSQDFPSGALLLTGTGVVPPDTFTLEAGDAVQIEISGIGILRNVVARV